MSSPRAEATAKKYYGQIADGYEAKRVNQDKWRREDEILGAWLRELAAGATVLDCPVGTGRLIPHFRAIGATVTGIDISPDMLAHARQKLTPADRITLGGGSIFKLGHADQSFDVACAIRIMNLIGPHDMQQALRELQRVARRHIILNLRVWHRGTKFRHPQRLEEVEAVLANGWTIVRNVEIHEPDFRMILLERMT